MDRLQMVFNKDLLVEVLEQMPAAVYLKSPDGTLLFANRQAREIAGEPPGAGRAYQGKKEAELAPAAPAELLERIRQHDLAVLAAATPLTFEESMPHPDGTQHAYLSTKFALRKDGEPYALVGISQDISEHKAVERALRQSEYKLQSAMKVTQFSPYEWNPQTGELRWDDGLRAMWGLPPGAPVDYAVFAAGLHPADRAYVEEQVAKAMDPQGDGVYAAEFRVIGLTDGVERWLSARGQTFFDAQNRPVYFVGAAQDITERKRTEEALQASEEKYRTLVTAMDQGFCIIEKVKTAGGQPSDFRYLTVNPAFVQHTGMRDVVGKTIRQLVPDAEQTVMEIYDVVVRTGEPQHFEAYISALDLWMEAEVLPAQMPGQLAILLSNVSERKRTELALRASEARLQAVANLVPDLLWESEPDGSSNWCNQRWLEYTGQSFAQAIGWGWTDAIHPDDRAASAHRYMTAVQTGQPLRQEHRVRRHNGEYRWFVVNAFPFKDESGKVVKMYGAATDIHEQRMARETLERRVEERTHELATVSATRQQILDSLLTAQEDERRRIAHDLHDSLGQYLVALNVGLKTVQEIDGFPPAAAVRIDALRDMVVRLDEEVEHLAFTLRPLALDDLGLADALRQYVQVWADDSQMAVDVHVRGQTEGRLPAGVETAIFRIVQEALTNIRKYAQATHVSLIVEQRPQEVRVIIEDNGQGFDPISAVAERGTRLHLGISGMRERAVLVGGELEIESAPGAGTTLYVRIPLSRKESAEQP